MNNAKQRFGIYPLRYKTTLHINLQKLGNKITFIHRIFTLTKDIHVYTAKKWKKAHKNVQSVVIRFAN